MFRNNNQIAKNYHTIANLSINPQLPLGLLNGKPFLYLDFYNLQNRQNPTVYYRLTIIHSK